MREILFRGKGTHGHKTGKWVYGNYAKDFWGKDRGGFSILPFDGGCYEVDPETVGQFTGLTDKNGKQIFEGDIVEVVFRYYNRKERSKFKVIFYQRNACFSLWKSSQRVPMTLDETKDYKVIGNIHDNPELLKGGA